MTRWHGGVPVTRPRRRPCADCARRRFRMSEGSLSDSRDRLLAETTWDRNVVVVAGAGTGKTTLLVNRVLNLLMRQPRPLDMTEIVGLTFTNKAEKEMKQGLRRELCMLA